MSTQRVAPQADRAPERVSHDAQVSNDGMTPAEGLTWVVLSVCLAVWFVTGFLLWIPRLLRAMILFSLALIQATVTEADGEDAARALRSAATFYWRGFVGAVESVRATRGEDSPGSWGIERELVLRELLWAVVVWYPLLWLAGFVQWTPADLWRTIASVPWSELGALIVGYFKALPGMLAG